MPKYWKKTLHVEILSEGDRPVFDDLKEVHYQITEGHCSGVVNEGTTVQLTREEMADALIEHGSDPDFLTNEDWEEDDDG